MDIILKLLHSPEQVSTITATARKEIEKKFNMSDYVTQIDELLHELPLNY